MPINKSYEIGGEVLVRANLGGKTSLVFTFSLESSIFMLTFNFVPIFGKIGPNTPSSLENFTENYSMSQNLLNEKNQL